MFRKFLWILALLVVSNLATYFWSEARLREIRDDRDRLVDAAARMAAERQGQINRLQDEVDRLESWGHLVDFQEELRKIDFEIESMNYGNALRQLDELDSQIQNGAMGGLLADSATSLEDDFESVRTELTAMSAGAAGRLRELGRSAFEALSGFSAEAGQDAGSELEEPESQSTSVTKADPDPPTEELPEEGSEGGSAEPD
jgi:HAMP domain-containing protein